MFLWAVAMLVASFVITALLMPKPQNAKPASLEDFDVPTAEDGREIPVLFGTRDIEAPNCVWYGDLKAKAIKKKGGKK